MEVTIQVTEISKEEVNWSTLYLTLSGET